MHKRQANLGVIGLQLHEWFSVGIFRQIYNIHDIFEITSASPRQDLNLQRHRSTSTVMHPIRNEGKAITGNNT